MADQPTLSGVSLKPETAEQVARAVEAMKHAGQTPPDHVVMMLEVIGHETEKRVREGEDFLKMFGDSSLMAQFSKIKPFQAGSDFEFIIQPQDGESADKALRALDRMVLEKIKRGFTDIPGIDELSQETVDKFMAAHRNWRLGEAHAAPAIDVIKAISNDMSIDAKQFALLRKLTDGAHHEKLEMITGNHIYPGDLVIQQLEERERQSGDKTIVAGWEPYKRHETVSFEIASVMPDLAKYGRFEASTDHTDKTPLMMIADYYEAFGRMRDEVARLEKDEGIRFRPPVRMTDHVHVSNENDMALSASGAVRKAAAVTDTMDAMVAALAPPNMLEREDSGTSLNRIKVNKIGYAVDDEHVMQGQRGYSLRGVMERKGAGEIPYGHFEARLGNSFDPFNVVNMTAAMVGGLNRTQAIAEETVERTEEQYRTKSQGIRLADIKIDDAVDRLTSDPRLDWIPAKARKALQDAKIRDFSAPPELPALDDVTAEPATEAAKKRAAGDKGKS